MSVNKKTVFITGATSGIGEATAIEFAGNGYNLIITGRREDRLQTLKKNIENDFGCKVLILTFDVRKRDEVEAAVNSLTDEWQKIDVLINNAGLALGLSPVQDGNPDDWDTMIDTNIKGLLYVTRCIAPKMINAGNGGHIINLGSIAGKDVYPNGNVYCATKFAVDALTKAMRFDMLQHGIKVTQIAPGAVETEFSVIRFKGDRDKAHAVYNGYTPLYAEDIAKVIYFVTAVPPNVGIADISIMPVSQAGVQNFYRR